jgi:hypothetical protein
MVHSEMQFKFLHFLVKSSIFVCSPLSLMLDQRKMVLLSKCLPILNIYGTHIINSHFQSQKKWLSTAEVTPFFTIRRYQQMAWKEARNYIAPPLLQWSSRYGTEFTYKGIPLSVTKFTHMFHGIFVEMEEIIESLTFGLAKDCTFPAIIDNPQENTPGYGFLMQDATYHWAVMRHILEDPQLFKKYFWIDGKQRCFNQQSNRHWLNQAA